ncbi:MAG: hypothetical protein WCE61_14355 [Candidatus Acidiferrum sp.]
MRVFLLAAAVSFLLSAQASGPKTAEPAANWAIGGRNRLPPDGRLRV